MPVEFSKGEWGRGQEEINLRYAEALEMADRHVLYKHGVKEIAWAQGASVTFMAKYDMGAAGSSCHLHSSVWDPRGRKNLFAAHAARGTPVPHCAGQCRGADFRHFYARRQVLQALPIGQLRARDRVGWATAPVAFASAAREQASVETASGRRRHPISPSRDIAAASAGEKLEPPALYEGMRRGPGSQVPKSAGGPRRSDRSYGARGPLLKVVEHT